MSDAATVTGTRLHHHGLTVSDLDRTARFYEEAFGARREWELEMSGEGVSEVVRVPGADLRVASLRFPNNGILELFEYRSPDGRPYDRRNNDIGTSHLGLEVDDIDAAYARLQELGVMCQFPPQVAEAAPIAGQRWFYFADPDGLLVELIQLPAA